MLPWAQLPGIIDVSRWRKARGKPTRAARQNGFKKGVDPYFASSVSWKEGFSIPPSLLIFSPLSSSRVGVTQVSTEEKPATSPQAPQEDARTVYLCSLGLIDHHAVASYKEVGYLSARGHWHLASNGPWCRSFCRSRSRPTAYQF